MEDKMLDEKEAAKILGLSVAWFQRSRHEGSGPAYVKYGRAVRYKLSTLLAYRAERERLNTSQKRPHKQPPIPATPIAQIAVPLSLPPKPIRPAILFRRTLAHALYSARLRSWHLSRSLLS